VEEVATKVMKANKAIKVFQTMAIVSLNMENLTFNVNTVKDKLVMGRRRRQCYKRN
jgi:GTP:adenosylcobinamide-phosphate guanylyltransferase